MEHILSRHRALSLRFAGRALARVVTALGVARERAALRKLDDRALADMGLTRADVARESARGFWDLPRGRLR